MSCESNTAAKDGSQHLSDWDAGRRLLFPTSNVRESSIGSWLSPAHCENCITLCYATIILLSVLAPGRNQTALATEVGLKSRVRGLENALCVSHKSSHSHFCPTGLARRLADIRHRALELYRLCMHRNYRSRS